MMPLPPPSVPDPLAPLFFMPAAGGIHSEADLCDEGSPDSFCPAGSSFGLSCGAPPPLGPAEGAERDGRAAAGAAVGCCFGAALGF